jgi:hypothetical protein
MITIRQMAASELDRIGEIDRSEHAAREYSYRHGPLESRAVDVAVRTGSSTRSSLMTSIRFSSSESAP